MAQQHEKSMTKKFSNSDFMMVLNETDKLAQEKQNYTLKAVRNAVVISSMDKFGCLEGRDRLEKFRQSISIPVKCADGTETIQTHKKTRMGIKPIEVKLGNFTVLEPIEENPKAEEVYDEDVVRSLKEKYDEERKEEKRRKRKGTAASEQSTSVTVAAGWQDFTTALNIATAAAEQGKPVNNSTNAQSEPAKNKRLSKAKKRKSDNENTERYEFINAFDPVIYEKFKLTCILCFGDASEPNHLSEKCMALKTKQLIKKRRVEIQTRDKIARYFELGVLIEPGGTNMDVS